MRKLITITAGKGNDLVYRDINGRKIENAEDMYKAIVERCNPNSIGQSEGVLVYLTNREWKNLRTAPVEEPQGVGA